MTEKERVECQKDIKLTDERYIIRKNGKGGFIDGCGLIRVQPEYDSVFEFTEGLARIEKNKKYGYVDKNGKEVIPLLYDDAWFFKEGLSRVKLKWRWGDIWGYINKERDLIIKFQYISAYSFYNGQAFVFDGKNVRLINKNGESVKILPDNFEDFKEDESYFKKKYKPLSCIYDKNCPDSGFYDYSGQEFNNIKIDRFLSSSKNGEKSTVDENSKQTYSKVCSDGFSIVGKKGGKEEIVFNKNNEIVLKGDFHASCPNENQLIYIKNKRIYLYDMVAKKIIFDMAGNDIKNKVFGSMSHFENKILIVKGFGEDSTMEIFDSDLKKVFLKIKPAGTIELFKTMEKNIRILKWKDQIYYLDENYRVFWSDNI
ncbi:MAG: WG repeat-containing protein [bacterium]